MAYIVGTLQTATQATGTSYTVNFPSGVLANDLLLVMLSQDGSTESLAVSASGFTALGTQTESGACSSLWFFKIAAGGETSATFACANDDIIGTAILVRDAHATEPFGASPASGTDYVRSDWNNVNSAASGSLMTAVDECLLIYSWCADGLAQYMRCKLSEVVELDKYNGGQINHIIGCNQQQTAGAAPTVTMYNHTATEGGNGWVLAVRNKSGGSLQPIPRSNETNIKYYGSWTTQHDSITWQAPDQFAATINSITCSATAPTVDSSNFYTASGSTYGANTRLTSTESTAGSWVGGTHTITSTDMTGKLFSIEMAPGTLSSAVTTGADGVLVGFSDGTNWATYQLITRAKGWAIGDPDRYFIALDTATPYATGGTWDATAKAAVTRLGYFFHRIGSSAGSANFSIKNAVLFDSVALTGGGSSRPVTLLDMQTYVNSWSLYRVALLQASSQVLVRTSIQIGDDTNATYFDGSAQSIEYPQSWSASQVPNWQMNWNAGDNSVGVSVKARDGDTIRLAAGVAATDTAQNLSISSASAAAADATYSFAQSFVGWRDPIDNKGLTWTGATFKECGTVTIAGGGDLTNCTIAKTSSANAALAITANGSTLDGTTIDVTGASAAYHLELGTSVTAVTLTDTTFTGTPGTDKVHVLKTTGTVTITISGTTSLVAGDVTSAGATVVIAAPSPTLDATILTGSRVVLYNDTTAAELDNTAPAGTSWSKVITSGASSGDTLTLHVFKEGYEEFSTSFIYAGIDNTLLVSQSVHAAIASLRTELSITDYTTITEFALDITGTVEIDADDADGSTTKARLAIWYNGVLTTENGARYLRGAITILSTAAFRINTSILDLKIENVSVTYGLNFTDIERRLYRDDGAAIYAAASAPGSIQNDYSGVPDTVTTSDQSLNLATAEQAIDNKLSSISSGVWAYVVTGSTTAVQMMRGFAAMLLGKVSGAGTTTEVFRDISDTKDVATFTVDSSGNRTAVTRDLT